MDTPILSQGAAGAADADLIKNTSTKDFMRDVIDTSREVPVLVDFWAPWCGPCLQLTPILEKAVHAAKGAVKLVKLNIDEHPQIPGQMGVQSIPAVFAFQDGRPVDGFIGALPEARIKAFIARLIGDEAADTAANMETAEAALDAGDVNTAAQVFAEALQKDAENARAAAGTRQVLHQDRRSCARRTDPGTGAAGQGGQRAGGERAGKPRARTESHGRG